jgi:hypothetical protein
VPSRHESLRHVHPLQPDGATGHANAAKLEANLTPTACLTGHVSVRSSCHVRVVSRHLVYPVIKLSGHVGNANVTPCLHALFAPPSSHLNHAPAIFCLPLLHKSTCCNQRVENKSNSGILTVSWFAPQIIAVHADDPEYKHISDISQLPRHRLLEIRRFFEDYKKNENKEVHVDEMLGANDARKSIMEAAKLYEKEYVPKTRHKHVHEEEAKPAAHSVA